MAGTQHETGTGRGHPGWRILATAMVVTIGLIGALVAPAVAAPLTNVDLQRLETSYQAQRAALAQRQAAELARFDATWAQTLADRQAAADAEQAQARAQRDAAVADVNRAGQAKLADNQAKRREWLETLNQHFAQKRVMRQVWVDANANAVPVGAVPYAQSAVKSQLDARFQRYKADLAVVTNAYRASDVFKQQYGAARSAANAQIQAFMDGQKARLAAITATYNANVTEAKNESAARVAQLADEKVKIDAKYKATVADVTKQRDREIAEAKAAGQSTTTISSSYSARLTEIKALYSIQLNENKAQVSATQNALSALLAQLKASYDEQYQYQLVVDAAQVAKMDADFDVSMRDLKLQIQHAGNVYQEAQNDLKAVYDFDVAVILNDRTKLVQALNTAMGYVDWELTDQTRAVEQFATDQERLLKNQTAAEVTLAQAPFERTIKQSVARAANDLVDLASRRDDARSTLVRRHAREVLLAKSEWLILKTKAEKYLKDAQSSLVPLDNFYDPASDQGSLFNVAKTIRVPSNATGAGVRVALIDTGVAPVDGLTQADVTIGPDFSFEDMNDDTRGLDTNGHGTHLAGIIVGRDDAWLDGNTSRAAARPLGVAPDARLIALKAGAADGSTDVSQVIAAINWVIRFNAENPGDPIRVINLAYGTDSSQDYTVDPLAFAAERAWKAGIVVVVSAGNDGWDTSHLAMPAADPFVIAVGAAQGSGDQAVATDFSSEGSGDRGVDLVAPGRSIVSLRNPGSFAEQINGAGRTSDTLVRGSGTSQAAAVVTGAVALLLQQRPTLTPDQVKRLLTATAKAVNYGDPRLSGAGLLDVGKALDTATIYDFGQQWAPATGTGSLEASRGTSHVLFDDGSPLMGERDVFGLDFSGSRWRDDAWSGSRWRDNGWDGSRWRTSGWDGSRWRTGDWSGSRWRDSGWDGSRWRDSAWDGSRWRGSRWRTSNWDGSRWRDNGWDGSRWRDNSWEGSRWRGFTL